LKKANAYLWTDECQEAFDILKEKLTSAPILSYPDFEQRFIVKTDASTRALGGVLCQEIDGRHHVVAYWSKTLTDVQRKYTIMELECLALVKAIDHFKHYLGGGPEFTAQTDHQALTWLMKSSHEMCHRLERWKLKLMHLNMKIEYRPGSTNYEADLLSRLEDGRVRLIQEERPRQNGKIYKTNELTIEEEQIFFLKAEAGRQYTNP